MNYNHKSIQAIESELYAIISTLNKLYEKYQKGIVSKDFFQKSFKALIFDFIDIKISLKENGIHLSDIIKEREFIEEYNKAIIVIDKISKVDLTKKLLTIRENNKLNSNDIVESSFLNLPGITSEITSYFITLRDAIKLDISVGNYFILGLFKNLKKQLSKFPGFEDLTKKIDKLYEHLTLNINTFRENELYRDKLGVHLNNIFKEFQDIMDLQLEKK